MNKELLVGTPVALKTGEKQTIVKAEGNNIKDIVITLSNKRIFNLYFSFKSGFLRFEKEEFNKEMTDFIENENKEIERLKKIEEDRIKQELEKSRLEKQMMEEAIREFRGDYCFLSNFYPVEVTYDGYTYLNNESAFQAQKDLSRRNEFTNLSPTSAKRLGRRVNLRSDWEQIKLSIMEEILRCKFDQHPDLKEKLINTGDRLLIEGNTWNDTFWGVCKGKGQNHLGLLLMKIRKEYQR